MPPKYNGSSLFSGRQKQLPVHGEIKACHNSLSLGVCTHASGQSVVRLMTTTFSSARPEQNR